MDTLHKGDDDDDDDDDNNNNNNSGSENTWGVAALQTLCTTSIPIPAWLSESLEHQKGCAGRKHSTGRLTVFDARAGQRQYSSHLDIPSLQSEERNLCVGVNKNSDIYEENTQRSMKTKRLNLNEK
jgi:hypothetical protein